MSRERPSDCHGIESVISSPNLCCWHLSSTCTGTCGGAAKLHAAVFEPLIVVVPEHRVGECVPGRVDVREDFGGLLL
jgi:hypothetical protein